MIADFCLKFCSFIDKLKTSSDSDTDLHKYEEVIKLSPEDVLEHYDILKGYIVLYVLRRGVPAVIVYNVKERNVSEVNCCEDIGEICPYANANYDGIYVKFKYTSPFVYEKEYKLNVVTKEWEQVFLVHSFLHIMLTYTGSLSGKLLERQS
eukprot:TRINITY_DN751_c0_g1_i1.p3 TRINITY_DN751_c0_g1~~TRINITY_DN751_c0_g1_i1.p3  ORF type:complete len:151 (-),score=8.32 TRINITY_DN751_c0_g1_i1:904-1356(-)